MISLITVTYNSRGEIPALLKSVERYFAGREFEHIIVDNDSTDGTADLIARDYPWVVLVRLEDNLGFAKGNNVGMARARGRWLFLVNPDLRFEEPIRMDLVDQVLSLPDCGMMTGRLSYPSGKVQESVRRFPTVRAVVYRGLGLDRKWPAWAPHARYVMTDFDYDVRCRVDWAIGAFLIGRKRVIWDTFHGFDERYFMYYEDADLALRMARAGLKVYYEPGLRAVHGYRRESAGAIASKLKWIHVMSSVRFLLSKQLGARRWK